MFFEEPARVECEKISIGFKRNFETGESSVQDIKLNVNQTEVDFEVYGWIIQIDSEFNIVNNIDSINSPQSVRLV